MGKKKTYIKNETAMAITIVAWPGPSPGDLLEVVFSSSAIVFPSSSVAVIVFVAVVVVMVVVVMVVDVVVGGGIPVTRRE